MGSFILIKDSYSFAEMFLLGLLCQLFDQH